MGWFMQRRNNGGMTNPRLLRGRHSHCGAYYVVTSVTERRRPLFRDPAVTRCIVNEIGRASGCVDTLAWVVMPDHVHWLFALGEVDLGCVVQAMKSRSTKAIHAVAGMREPVWQRGYFDHRLRSDEDLHGQARYIVANPLRAGLVETLAAYPFWWCKWISGEREL